MKRMYGIKAWSGILAGMMTLGLTGCGKGTEQDTGILSEDPPVIKTESAEDDSEAREDEESGVGGVEISYPLDTDVKLTVWTRSIVAGSEDAVDWERAPFYTGLTERTGVEVKWKKPTKGADVEQASTLIWLEEELPDVIKSYIPASQGAQLLADELIWDLTDYLPEYAPDFWEYIHRPENELELKLCQTEKGEFYMIPNIQAPECSAWIGPVIRQDWLDECGLEQPVTIEEWENVLVTFKEKYGAKMGYESAYANNCGGIASGFNSPEFMGLNFGLNDKGEVIVAPMTDEWWEMMACAKDWWERELIDEDVLTMDEESLRNKCLNNEIGISFVSLGCLGRMRDDAAVAGNGAEWVGTGYARTAKDAPTRRINVAVSGLTNYPCVITTGATQEEMITALEWLNYGYTEEGIKYHNFGQEGVSYSEDAEGNITILVEDLANYTSSGSFGTVNLGYSQDEYRREATEKWLENTVANQYMVAEVPMTEEEFDVYSKDYGAICTFSVEEYAKFLTGARSLSEREEFMQQLEALNLKGVLEAWNSAYDRFINR